MAAGRSTDQPAAQAAVAALTDHAERIGAGLPAILVEADRVAHTVAQGLHGRRRAGPGEAFWQFRRYRPGDMAGMIDWRKSARSTHHLIREKEWEAANTVWLWADLSRSMDFRSRLARTSKRDRAILLSLALGGLLVRGGERIGILGSGAAASAGRTAVRRAAELMVHGAAGGTSLPPPAALNRFSNVVLFSDFLEPVEEISHALAAIAARDVRGHLVQVLDPIEESFPFAGRTEFESLGGTLRLIVGRAEQLRQGYRHRLAEHREQLQEIARRLEWTFTCHHTDRPPQSILLTLHGLLAGEPAIAAGSVESSGLAGTAEVSR
jgi:uncharacterized protein (DUF58 family)